MLYKTTGLNGEAIHGGHGTWDLPCDGQPGAWREVAGSLKPLGGGLSLCRKEHLVRWLGPAIWEADYDGESIWKQDRVVVRKARLVKRLQWDDQTANQFAHDCLDHSPPKMAQTLGALEPAYLFASNSAMVALAWAADTEAERRWQTERLFQYLNGEI